MENIKQYNTVIVGLLSIIVSMATLGCSNLHKPLGMNGGDSDEEAENYGAFILQEIEEDEQAIETAKSEIATKRRKHENLGDKNEYLQRLRDTKKEALDKILTQIRKDAAHDDDLMRQNCPQCTFYVKCKKCGVSTRLTFSRFKELVNKYRLGYTYDEQYRWFLWWEWGHHKTNYQFTKCFKCMDEQDIQGFEKSINKNADALARLEAEIVQKRATLASKEHELKKDERSRDTVRRQDNSRRRYRDLYDSTQAELAARQQEDEEGSRHLEELEAAIAESRKIIKEKKEEVRTLAQQLLAKGVAMSEVIAATGLT